LHFSIAVNLLASVFFTFKKVRNLFFALETHMKFAPVVALCYVSALFVSGTIEASCTNNGKRTQMVWLSSSGKPIDNWEVDPNQIRKTKLTNGFELGLKIEPATSEKYRELTEKLGFRATDELVKISVYDMSKAQPKLLTYTWGGANSQQGYGPRGGAARVDAVGEPGIELWLHKAVCVGSDGIARP
jgi:hypothetical protein